MPKANCSAGELSDASGEKIQVDMLSVAAALAAVGERAGPLDFLHALRGSLARRAYVKGDVARGLYSSEQEEAIVGKFWRDSDEGKVKDIQVWLDQNYPMDRKTFWRMRNRFPR